MNLRDDFDVNASWRWLLQEIILAKNALTVGSFGDSHIAKPLLDFMLPSLLFMRAVSVLDEALAFYIDDGNYAVPRQYGSTLHGRLSFLNDQHLLMYSQDLRDMKDRRNEVAHYSNTPATLSTNVTWQEVDQAIGVIEAALQHLSLIGQRPDFHFFSVRDPELYPIGYPPHPDKPGVTLIHHHRYGIKEGETEIFCVSMSIDYYAPGYGPPQQSS